MPRLLAIDYGTKRCGIAVTDNLQLIATGLTTVATSELFSFLQEYFSREQVSELVVGNPKRQDNSPSETAPHVRGLVKKLASLYPKLPIHLLDERFTTVLAQRAMLEGGSTRKQRQNKGTVDMISATILLQNYLESKKF